MRILLSLMMSVMICVLFISCGAKDVSAPTTDNAIETTTQVPETNTSVDTTDSVNTESEYLHLGGMKSDILSECKVMVREVKNSEYCFVEDKDSQSKYSLKVSEKKKLPCSIASKDEVDTQSLYGEVVALGTNADDDSKVSYKAIRRTEPASEGNDVYFIFVDYGCKHCQVEFLVTLSTNNDTVTNDDKVTQYGAKIIKQIEFNCPTCCG